MSVLLRKKIINSKIYCSSAKFIQICEFGNFFKALKLKLLSYRTMFQPIRKCTRLIKITNDVVRGGKIVVLGKCYQLVK